MQYDLVFEGGGAKGMAFVGAMREFEAAGHTIGRLIGSSAGAITAATLAAGYSAAEMLDSLNEKAGDQPVFATFLGDPPPPDEIGRSALAEFLRAVDLSLVPEWAEGRLENRLLAAMAGNTVGRHLLSFFEYGGFYSADAFVAWFERKLNEGVRRDGRRRNYGGLTFAQLHAETGIDLSLTASDVTHNRLRILNHRTTPDLPVVWGTRMSMSLPLLWQEVVWLKEWGTYHGFAGDRPVEMPLAGSVMVDGGLLSNFPIELLVSTEPLVKKIMGPDEAEAVVGFLIDEALPVPNAPSLTSAPSPALDKLGSLRTTQRLKGLVDTVTQARDKMVIEENKQRVVRLPAKTYGTTEFAMNEPRRNALINAAAAITKSYFDKAAAGGLESLESLSTDESDRIALGILSVN